MLKVVDYERVVDYPPPIAREEILRWVELIVGTHPVPPAVSVAQFNGLHEPARSATQTYFNMEAFRHTHSLLPARW